MPPRNNDGKEQTCPGKEETFQVTDVLPREHGETRERRALVAIERRRDAPDAAVPLAQLCLFLLAIFDQAVRRIGHDRFHAVCRRFRQPVETIAMNERCISKPKRFTFWHCSGGL